jgi:peptide subunit release factor 1 (eRF1)
MHRQYHHCTDQNEQGIGAVNQGVHSALQIFHKQADLKAKKAPKRFMRTFHAPSCDRAVMEPDVRRTALAHKVDVLTRTGLVWDKVS